MSEKNNTVEKDELYKIYNPKGDGVVIEEGEETEPEEQESIETPIEEEPEEELSEEQIEKLLKVSDATLSKMGIDDPKQWKSYQRALTKTKMELKQKELESNKPNRSEEKIAQLERQIQELKKPPEEPLKKPEMPKMPKRPVDFNYADITDSSTSSGKYIQDREDYDFQMMEYHNQLDEYRDKRETQLREALETDRLEKAKEREFEERKTQVLSSFISEGLSPAEAQEEWSKITKEPENYFSPKRLAKLAKIERGIDFQLPDKGKGKKFDNIKNKRQHNPPPGIGGGVNQGAHPNEFSKSSDTSWMYSTKK